MTAICQSQGILHRASIEVVAYFLELFSSSDLSCAVEVRARK